MPAWVGPHLDEIHDLDRLPHLAVGALCAKPGADLKALLEVEAPPEQ